MSDPLTGVLIGAVVAWSVIRVVEIVIEVAFRVASRRRSAGFDADRTETRELLTQAHAALLQIGELLATARTQADEIQRLTDQARHSTSTRTAAIRTVPPSSPPSAPAAY